MPDPVVSIVMSSHNCGAFLRESIESMLGQTYEHFEFIIVDDGSTDESATILKDFANADKRVRVVSNGKKGLVPSLNIACAMACGKYIARMDADDVSLPHRLATQVAYLDKRHDVAVVGSWLELIGVDGRVIDIWRFPTAWQEIQEALDSWNCMAQNSVVMRTEVYHRAGGYRHAFLAAEDYDLWTRIADHHRIENIAEVLVKYRIHPEQTWTQKLEAQTLSVLAVQASTKRRRANGGDPLVSCERITRDILAELGFSGTEIDQSLFGRYVQRATVLWDSGDQRSAIRCVQEGLRLKLQAPPPSNVLSAVLSQLLRYQWAVGDHGSALSTACQIMRVDPFVVPRVAKRLAKKYRG